MNNSICILCQNLALHPQNQRLCSCLFDFIWCPSQHIPQLLSAPPLNWVCLRENRLQIACEFFPLKKSSDFERHVPLILLTTTNASAVTVIVQLSFEMSSNVATPGIPTRLKHSTESAAPCNFAKKDLVGIRGMLAIHRNEWRTIMLDAVVSLEPSCF